MFVSELKGQVHREIIESLYARGVERLTPPQEMAMRSGLADGNSMVVSAPTASGKTLIAEIACVGNILSGRKSIYIAPMRALVSEKYSEFTANYPYIRCAISMGDLDSNDLWLSDYDMLFVSTEKLDSLIRHGISWLDRVGCVVFDEVHMIGDASRGPTLELMMTRMKSMHLQLIALSATIGNAKDMASWLNAKCIESDYRPVKLVRGIIKGGTAYTFHDGKETKFRLSEKEKIEMPEISLLDDTLSKGKQLLIFYSSKRNAEAGAARMAEHMKRLGIGGTPDLIRVADSVAGVLDHPTKQCEKLSELLRNAAAFHHSGLLNQQRKAIEDGFRENIVKVVCSTTTLGLGVNLPAHTVLVRDIVRHNGFGSERISVNEVMQLFGRAGRPKYDTEGRAFVQIGPNSTVKEMAERYIYADPEPIYSALGMAPVMRTHILSFISSGFLTDKNSIKSFINSSFYGYQYGRKSHVDVVVDDAVDELALWDFIKPANGKLTATKLGKRISELYIDPLSAKWMIDNDRIKEAMAGLYVISNTVEMRPYIRPSRAKREEVEEEFVRMMESGVIHPSSYEKTYGFQDEIGAYSTAKILHEWIDEKSEESIMREYNASPGALYSKISNADWVLYSWIELLKIIGRQYRSLVDVRVRIRYGIRAELLDLVRLEQVGRVRARRLYDNGIRTVVELRENREKAELILGKEVIGRIFAQFA